MASHSGRASGTRALERKAGRLSLRTNPYQESLIRLAAEVEGKTVGTIVLDSATATARQVLADEPTFPLGPVAWDEFVAGLIVRSGAGRALKRS